MQDNLRVCRIAWSKIAGNRVYRRKSLFLPFSAMRLLNLWDFSFERRPRKVATSSTLSHPLPLLLDIDPFFRPPRQFRDIWTRVVLNGRHPLAQKTKLHWPSRRPRAEIEKNRNYTRRERKLARFRHVLTRFPPSPRYNHNPRSSSTLLRLSMDVIGAAKETRERK